MGISKSAARPLVTKRAIEPDAGDVGKFDGLRGFATASPEVQSARPANYKFGGYTEKEAGSFD